MDKIRWNVDGLKKREKPKSKVCDTHTHTHTHTHIRMLKKIHFSNAHGTVRTSFTLVVVL